MGRRDESRKKGKGGKTWTRGRNVFNQHLCLDLDSMAVKQEMKLVHT